MSHPNKMRAKLTRWKLSRNANGYPFLESPVIHQTPKAAPERARRTVLITYSKPTMLEFAGLKWESNLPKFHAVVTHGWNWIEALNAMVSRIMWRLRDVTELPKQWIVSSKNVQETE